jgi:hypothetical protein
MVACHRMTPNLSVEARPNGKAARLGHAPDRRESSCELALSAGWAVGQGSGAIRGMPHPALKRAVAGRPLTAVVHVAFSVLPVTAA